MNEFIHLSHNVTCFFSGHRYRRVGERQGYQEYACLACGHPLLFNADFNPYEGRNFFKKKVRYLCNLFGHRVQQVTERQGLQEYACRCGHSFLKETKNLRIVKHPAICLFAGHSVRWIDRRSGLDEHCCRRCGHTFLS